MLETLNDMGLIARSTEGNWILACDARQTSMAPVVERFLLDQTRRACAMTPKSCGWRRPSWGQPAPTLEDLCQAQNTENEVVPVLGTEARKK